MEETIQGLKLFAEIRCVNKYLLQIWIFTYRDHLWFGDHLFSQCGHANLSYFDVCHCNQRSNCRRWCLLHDFKIFRYVSYWLSRALASLVLKISKNNRCGYDRFTDFILKLLCCASWRCWHANISGCLRSKQMSLSQIEFFENYLGINYFMGLSPQLKRIYYQNLVRNISIVN